MQLLIKFGVMFIVTQLSLLCPHPAVNGIKTTDESSQLAVSSLLSENSIMTLNNMSVTRVVPVFGEMHLDYAFLTLS